MKTKNYPCIYRIKILFAFIIFSFSFFLKAQVKVSSTGGAIVNGTTTAPDYGLKVDTGHINLADTANAYQIGGNNILSAGAHNTKIGFGAGSSITSGTKNTFTGFQAGKGNTTGSENTIAGDSAAYYNTTGNYSTIMGYRAGRGTSSTSGCDYNTFFGYKSGEGITTGDKNVLIGPHTGYNISTASYNTLIGYNAGVATNGSENVFLGYQAGYTTGSGGYNTFLGSFAGYSNTAFYNTFTGEKSGYSNTEGTGNTFYGYQSGYSNNSNSNNTFSGYQTGYSSTGANNTAYGYKASYANTTGMNNTAIGYLAGDSYAADSNCTFIGYGADATANLNNATAIGYNSSVDTSHKVRIGNSSIQSIGGNVGWTVFSDSRIKNNVQENVRGLDFIKLLRPVTYNYDVDKQDQILGINNPSVLNQNVSLDSLGNPSNNPQNAGVHSNSFDGKYDIEQIYFSGFLAQEVDSAAQKVGYNFSGIDKHGKIMGLRYAEFTVPLVKAVQELSATVDSLKQKPTERMAIDKVDSLMNEIENLKTFINQCCNFQQNETSNISPINNNSKINIDLQLSDNVILYQNIPNPFTDETTINYYLPETVGSAMMHFYDDAGRLIKSMNLEMKGNNSIVVNTTKLANGIYSYAVEVDGKVIETKKMLRNK